MRPRLFVSLSIGLLFPLFVFAATCPNLTRNLSFGSRGQDVVELQNFLITEGDLAPGNNTGNYRGLTEAAVKQFQCQQNIICSGSPATTGWGVVGPRTRTAIMGRCSTTAIQTIQTTQTAAGTQAAARTQTTNTTSSQHAIQNPVVTGEIIDVDQTRFGQAFPTWNSHLPKMASDGVWDYAIYSRYPLNFDDRYAKIYKKKHGTTSWTYAGRTWRDIHQPPGIVIDTQGHVHVVFSCVSSNKACSDGGFNSTDHNTFYDMIFTKKNADGSADFASSVWNYSEWTGAEWGYMGVGTDPLSGDTYVSLGSSYEPLLQKVFKVGVYMPTQSSPPPIGTSVNQQYPQFAFNAAGRSFYATNESIFPGISGATFSYTNTVLYRFVQGVFTKVFSDHVDAPTGIDKAVFGSDMAYMPDGRLYYLYYKAPAINGNCNYLVKEKTDGTFGSPVGVGCFNQTPFNQGPYPQLQIDSKGNVYILSFDHTNLILAKSIDDGATWTRYTLPVNYVPSDTVALTGPTVLKPWSSSKGFSPDQLYGIMGGEDANRNAWYLATFCINLSDFSSPCSPGTVSPPPPPADMLSSGSNSVPAGDALAISWNKSVAAAKDWIAFAPTGQAWSTGNPWIYTGGTSQGSKNILAPAVPGVYDLIYYINDTTTEALRKTGIQVTAPLGPVALVPGTQAAKAGAQLSVSWYVVGDTHPHDWITLVPQGQKWSSPYPWFYTDAVKSGVKTLAMPNAAGIYDLVYFANDNPSVEVYRQSGVVTIAP